ncbi:hypothetical protein JCM4814A_77890 [Streptomyces phaeofaciens JCM 4814]|uniref:Secreted protein n=1 Tax=Streptomyces phaeofaciens TaxID=68254 RepID=A0A918LWJ3_9ACTN|nr:hypothetical protein [Streptomyces phaeofaciens]GGT60228.1 hypothetical protein GCM10010226_42030 [Streptomyces phaeofaciens]
MSSTARRVPHGRTWLRAFVLLLALLAPGAATELSATPVTAAETVEYDVVDPALRPAPGTHRPAAPLRPAPSTAPAPALPAERPRPTPPRTPYALRALRTVVLRC